MLDSRKIALDCTATHWVAQFVAMACPCEVLGELHTFEHAQRIAQVAAQCAWRVEDKFSRYRGDNIIHAINNSNGCEVTVDDETANLLDFAATLYQLSAGRFDITSGVLRRAWQFDGSDRIADQSQINALLELVGWDKVQWHRPVLRLLPAMQIDLGGIGKEYAVDAASQLIDAEWPGASFVVNFGGDVAVKHSRRDQQPWKIGIEAIDNIHTATKIIQLQRGGLATSGDSRRFIIKDGKRYSHILDARTGWPVVDSPRSVTVAADTCTQAGTYSTLAMLQGKNAASFLKQQTIQFWLQ
jgi:FAD:protein FMN transferase